MRLQACVCRVGKAISAASKREGFLLFRQMENNAGWHGKAPNDAEYEQAINELKAILTELEGK